MVRCVIGLGGAMSSDFPFLRAHVGRAFVEYVATAQHFGPWRPNSVALADFAEHGSGVVLCRLWPDATKETIQAQVAAKQSLKYLGIRSPKHFVLAHAETRKKCGRFMVEEGPKFAPTWAKPVLEAVAPEWRPGRKDIEQPLRIVFGVGSPSRSNLQPRMEQFGDARMTAREANAIVQSAFPAAYEWLLKRWFGPTAVTEGAVLRRHLEQDKRRPELDALAAQMREG
ncbi:unnamed protein product [Cladocopium goreaui]|uniref:Uncharacterized protein n=1 Tax=Cladocopium goreaui TaxID=2562237 RepID=A0A9P1FH35_9DINO|nr:unnamed protein product [Cladocopium goreaui]